MAGTTVPIELKEQANFLLAQYIRQRLDLGWPDNTDPGPAFFEHMFVKELQSISIHFNGAPGIRID